MHAFNKKQNEVNNSKLSNIDNKLGSETISSKNDSLINNKLIQDKKDRHPWRSYGTPISKQCKS